MAFHVACPITCERICHCELGFAGKLQSEKGRREFLEEIARVEEFLRDPWCVRDAVGDGTTVQVLVPRIAPPVVAPDAAALSVDDGGGAGDGEEIVSVQAKRAAMQRQAVAASQAAEDYVRRLETGAAAEISGEAATDLAREEQGSSIVKVMCRICFSGENEGSDRASKMLSCKICNKKYHRSCLKTWAEYRDLFHWSSWACPSCRICEVCRRAGDPNKFMFCKRCDAAYHCYCQQPPHKNVSHGPYLCPKHTRCHSCGSNVPGSGLSTRWFLGYTCCDACGRLFVKGKYCPVCLKVYRDSESTPMVCCDVCQRWVHCLCDGISDEKYQQFQADSNLYYKCAACRGECYQVKDIDDAVQELWRRRDKSDRDEISSLRAAAGLPSQEEIFCISPYSDDEDTGPVILKSDYGRTLKFSVKGLTDKATKSTKEYGKKFTKKSSSNKKYSKKKGYQMQLGGKPEDLYQNLEGQNEARSFESTFEDHKINDTVSYRIDRPDIFSSPNTSSPGYNRVKSSSDQQGSMNHGFVDGVVVKNIDMASKLESKGVKSYGLHLKETTGKHESKSESVKGTKLVIHLAARNRNLTSSPRSEASASNGSEESSKRKASDHEMYTIEAHDGQVLDERGAKLNNVGQLKSSKHGGRGINVIKLGKVSGMRTKISNNSVAEECAPTATARTLILRTRMTEGSSMLETVDEARKDLEILPGKQSRSAPVSLRSESQDTAQPPSVLNSLTQEPKPLLKLKFKNPYLDSQSSWMPRGEEEKSSVKGQRSKRKRPLLVDKGDIQEDITLAHSRQENSIDEVMDANWILQKLGKDAIGKRVEVHQSSENSWHKGVVFGVIEGSTSLSVRLDDGRETTLELGKQGVRFISQKQKRTKL